MLRNITYTKRTTMKMKIALSLVFLVIASVYVNAQNSQVLKARTAYMSGAFCEAVDLGRKAHQSIPSKNNKRSLLLKGEMATLVADSWRYQEHYREADEWYEKAILVKYYETDPEVYLYKAEMLRMMTEYDKAKEMYEEYMKLVPESDIAKAGLSSCEMNEDFKANRTRHIIENEVL